MHPIPPFGEQRGRGGGTAVLEDGVRVFRQFAWLQVGSVKAALFLPAHQRVPRRERAGQAASRWAAVRKAKAMNG